MTINVDGMHSVTLSSSATPPHTLNISGHRLRNYAEFNLKHHPLHQIRPFLVEPASPPIRIVCISDTHNHRPEVPSGDILIHAGDLTDNGSLDELQAGLDWLSIQPHAHKIFVAGNHDVLLDESLLARCPERRYGSSKTLQDLVWPKNIIYLNDNSITLEIAKPATNQDGYPAGPPDHVSALSKQERAPRRKIRIYGSPYTPHHVPLAFQYPRTNTTFWENKIPPETDIVVTHGPPRLHLDAYSGLSRGCAFLGEEIARIRPKLHVFGHIHDGYGREEVVFDSTRREYEAIVNFSCYNDGYWGCRWWWALGKMAMSTLWCRVKMALLGRKRVERRAKVTVMVNASVVAWDEVKREKDLRNEAIVVEI